MNTHFQRCSRCILDTTVQDILFDEKGECNYCKVHDIIDKKYPIDESGQRQLNKIVKEMKFRGKGKRYDCILGVSGGTDSTFLLYWAKSVGLRPLAVNFDNGWNSEIAVRNIENATEKLGVDLYTYVVDWEEFKDLQIAFLKASTPDSEGPTDIALRAALYRVAAKEKVKYILIGVSFRTEGKVPIFWSYIDGRYIKSVHKRFGKVKFRTYPNFTIFDYLYYGFIKGIKQIRPLWYLDYNKPEIMELLKKELNWEYYGGHHYESIYTRFNQGYYLVKKFGIDKRRVEYSAQIRSGFMTREGALEKIKEEPYPIEQQKEDVDYVRERLNLSKEDFNAILNAKTKTFLDYSNYYSLLIKYPRLIRFAFKFIYKSPPQILYYLQKKS